MLLLVRKMRSLCRTRLRQRKPTARQLLVLCIAAAAVFLVLKLTLLRPDNEETYRQYRFDIPLVSGDSKDGSSHDLPLAAVCADAACGEKFLAKFPQHERQPRIPAIRHILWKSEHASKYFVEQLKTWQGIHPNWTFVLWRDSDLEPFVRKHFPGNVYKRFTSLPESGLYGIKRIDMFRYMLLYKFGGVYADLDYTLVSSLDSHRRYPAVVTREPEVHAVQYFGLLQWPLPVMANPAFFMAAPGHPFFYAALLQLVEKCDASVMGFAGPFGLSRMLSTYYQMHMIMADPAEFVYIPPSYSFYPYDRNRLDSGHGVNVRWRIQNSQRYCGHAADSTVPQVQQFCKDVLNLDPITDKTQPVIAIHDMQKRQPVYDDESGSEYSSDMENMMAHLTNLKLGEAFT